MKNIGKLALPIETNDGFEVVRLITEKNELYALVKVPVDDLPNLRILKTDKQRRDYQKKAQERYREKLKGTTIRRPI